MPEKMDYLTFALTKSCNFKCPYCCSNGAGEAQFSKVAHVSPLFVRTVSKIGVLNGIKRIRLSGGEPFMHKRIGQIVRSIAESGADEIVLDTNASIINDQENIISDPPKQLGVVCSIDSLTEKGYDFHSGIKGGLVTAIKNIRTLAASGVLKRLNMVVTEKNKNEVSAMANFCRELGVPLKLSDVGIRRNQIGKFSEIYTPLSNLKERLNDQGEVINDNTDYSRGFGTPCDTFSIEGQKIKIKDSSKGARYNLSAICNECEYFPCSEGLYMITAMPDGAFSGCQSNGYNFKLTPAELFDASSESPSPAVISRIAGIFQEMIRVIESSAHIDTDLSKNLRREVAING
jgi:MoaA/NifB/PqqE/SkfB family radical SAM enzyme